VGEERRKKETRVERVTVGEERKKEHKQRTEFLPEDHAPLEHVLELQRAKLGLVVRRWRKAKAPRVLLVLLLLVVALMLVLHYTRH
jgi:hypothetical protein